MKIFISQFFALFLTYSIHAQDSNINRNGISLCGKTGEYSSAKKGFIINFSQDEIGRCPMKLIPYDSTVEISSFKVSISGKAVQYKEYDFRGDSIPEKYKSVIFTPHQKIYVEYIKAKLKGREVFRSFSPMSIEIEVQ